MKALDALHFLLEVRLEHSRPSHSNLHEYLRIVRGVKRPGDGFFLRAESFFNVATDIERMDAESSMGRPIIDSYGGKSLHEQSHGESFMQLMVERFRAHGLYLLDEPEAALSPGRQLAFLVRMHQLIQQGSQLVIATHSPIVMGYPDADILVFGERGLERVAYEDTEHFTVARRFLNDRAGMLRELLED